MDKSRHCGEVEWREGLTGLQLAACLLQNNQERQQLTGGGTPEQQMGGRKRKGRAGAGMPLHATSALLKRLQMQAHVHPTSTANASTRAPHQQPTCIVVQAASLSSVRSWSKMAQLRVSVCSRVHRLQICWKPVVAWVRNYGAVEGEAVQPRTSPAAACVGISASEQ